jgi:hypothetical protein
MTALATWLRAIIPENGEGDRFALVVYEPGGVAKEQAICSIVDIPGLPDDATPSNMT